MTTAITHKFVNAKADGADATVVRPSNWNDMHALQFASAALVITDTLTVFTIADATITALSNPLVSIKRALASVNGFFYDDNGWVFSVNVIAVQAGSFTVMVGAHLWGSEPVEDAQPNETVTLVYAGG